MSIGKNGIIKEQSFSTTLLCQYDTNFYIEPDGSVWIKIFHHNNPSSYLFSSSDTFTTSVYKDENRWFNISLCNLVSKWELMIKQKQTDTSTEVKYRWIQPKNPMTSTYEDVPSSVITKNTSSGYTNFSYGGLYPINGNTYLCANNGIKGHWWGSVGAWNTHQGGIPAWASTVVTNGYMDLYLRVDDLPNNTKTSKNKVGFYANDFYEI